MENRGALMLVGVGKLIIVEFLRLVYIFGSGGWRESVNREFSTYPVVMSEYGDMHQGCSSGGISLTELRPEGPSDWGHVRTGFSNANPYSEGDRIKKVSGDITDIQKDRSFKVVDKGDDSFTEPMSGVAANSS